MQRHKGFSLLEILVAFAIMAVALTIVLRIFGSGVHSAVVSEDYVLATQIAESMLARVGADIPLQAGLSSGSEGNRYHWLLGIEWLPPMFDSRHSLRDDTQQAQTLERYRVRIRVEWGDEGQPPHGLELETLKLRAVENP
ncbi:MAG: prepilin-type N-terminal cleavage/methylation domain-containing protein [Methylomonas sp.]|nr:prepilin-type N-terminal cleavage/methylation domain-containing protein [Methylomonas sp.]MBS3964764.1 prepilin-type N-terminal cleavage/methylation domain-containing protein [Methylomonas sp.]PPD22640.1 MAG: general secretion pathway protein GspH [Methylomonas sp.]PPD27952.1 MAG: general secretion pathway protein GspH [Methylomonas sp.]PPD40061.1 MAG: general secretion pathway protein GspH [Methylomonas sp.]